MSMIDWFNRPKENPWESARRFRQSDPLASRRIGQEAVEPGQEDPLADRFQPQNLETPMTAGEQAFEERIAEADQAAASENQMLIQTARLEQEAREREAFKRMREEEELARQQQADMPTYRSDGRPFEVSGEIQGTRRDVLEEAGKYVGTPYQLGGRTVKGIDCSGLVMAVYNKAGLDISQHSAGWQGRNIPGVRTAVNNLQPGDIVAWKDGSHIAIYAGNGMIVDSARSGGTRYRPMWGSPEQTYGIKLRFPGE